MANIIELTKQFVTEEKEIMNDIIKMLTFENIAEMDPEGVSVLYRCLKLMNTANELLIEESKLLDSLNDKLDKVLEQTKK